MEQEARKQLPPKAEEVTALDTCEPLDFSIKKENSTPASSSEQVEMKLPPDIKTESGETQTNRKDLNVSSPEIKSEKSRNIDILISRLKKADSYTGGKLEGFKAKHEFKDEPSTDEVEHSVDEVSDSSVNYPASDENDDMSYHASIIRIPTSIYSGFQEQFGKSIYRAKSLTAARNRRSQRKISEKEKDEKYWERRRRNNEAARRSRDARRAKEGEIATRAALLEQENLKLKLEVASLKTEIEKLKYMLMNDP